VAKEPHAERHIQLKGKARSNIKCVINLFNDDEITKTYKVDSDLPGIQGDSTFSLKAMKNFN